MANALGLTREDCLRIHEHYFADVADEAWLDGRLTDDEERELKQVGELLSIDADVIDAAIAGTTGRIRPRAGMRDAATIASRMPRTAAHDGSRTADPEHLQSDAMPPADTRSRATQESDGKSQRQPCRRQEAWASPFPGGCPERRRATRYRPGQAGGALHHADSRARTHARRQRADRGSGCIGAIDWS